MVYLANDRRFGPLPDTNGAKEIMQNHTDNQCRKRLVYIRIVSNQNAALIRESIYEQ